MQSFFKSLIKFYRFFLSPVLGGQCRFYPSCSSYALESFESLPVGRALLLTLKRVLFCHPLHAGGFDPVERASR